MTKNEVIKGLEYHIAPPTYCDGCPYENDLRCENTLIRDAIALLKEGHHGKWAHVHEEIYVCSECDTKWDYPYTYCPSCGARMDGGDTNAFN